MGKKQQFMACLGDIVIMLWVRLTLGKKYNRKKTFNENQSTPRFMYYLENDTIKAKMVYITTFCSSVLPLHLGSLLKTHIGLWSSSFMRSFKSIKLINHTLVTLVMNHILVVKHNNTVLCWSDQSQRGVEGIEKENQQQIHCKLRSESLSDSIITQQKGILLSHRPRPLVVAWARYCEKTLARPLCFSRSLIAVLCVLCYNTLPHSHWKPS